MIANSRQQVTKSFPRNVLSKCIRNDSNKISSCTRACGNRKLFDTNNVVSKRQISTITSKLVSFGKSNRMFLNSLQMIQRRSVFIQTESTPNPESLKFVPGKPVLGESDENKGYYATKDDVSEINRSPLMKHIFKVDGVKSIYLGADFVTVTKLATAHWLHLQTEVCRYDYYVIYNVISLMKCFV